jgi:hypothetical protein
MFKEVAKLGLNNLYEYYFAAFAALFLLKIDLIRLSSSHTRIRSILNGLFRDRCSNYLCSNFVLFVLNSAHRDTFPQDAFVSFTKTALDSQQIVNPLALFAAGHPRVREICYSLSVQQSVYIRAIVFSLRVNASDDRSVSCLFTSLERIIENSKASHYEIKVMQNVVLAATILFDVIFTKRATYPAGSFLCKTVVTEGISPIFHRDLWYSSLYMCARRTGDTRPGH